MVRKLEAVYEGGVLRPVELQFAPREELEPLADHSVMLESVGEALSKISGSLDSDFAAGRNER